MDGIDVRCSAPDQQTVVFPILPHPIPESAIYIIDGILRNAGSEKSFAEIPGEAEQISRNYDNLKEDYVHARKIIAILTRYRFCPHSEQKRRTGKLPDDLMKMIDKQGWIPPEYEGVDPQIVEQIRNGEIRIVDDGTFLSVQNRACHSMGSLLSAMSAKNNTSMCTSWRCC